MDHMMGKPIANGMIKRETKWQWDQNHRLGSNHDGWNQHQWTKTVEIYTQGILARYDWIREPMDPQMGKLYTLNFGKIVFENKKPKFTKIEIPW